MNNSREDYSKNERELAFGISRYVLFSEYFFFPPCLLVLLSFNLEFTLPCTEDVPTCGDSCDKVLECGIHKCSQRCHRGPCEICRQVSPTAGGSHYVRIFKQCMFGTLQVF